MMAVMTEYNKDIDFIEFIKVRISDLQKDLEKLKKQESLGFNRRYAISETLDRISENKSLLLDLMSQDIETVH